MLQLLNGCSASTPAISPKNWKTAKTNKNWFIHYRFYDPIIKEYPKGKQIILKCGINKLKDLSARRILIKQLLEEEIDLLVNQHYNPITKVYSEPENCELSENTPFIKALNYAVSKIQAEPETITDIKSVVRGVERSAKELSFNMIPICKVRRKHIKRILEQCFVNNPRFTAKRFNKYKYYLSKLFVELIELEAAEYNAPRDIINKIEEEKERLTLTDEERKKVYDHLYRMNRHFLNFVQLFFHSGGRITELLRLKGKDIDLVNQKYTALIKKGGRVREVKKTIKDVALPYWTEFVQNCDPDHYVFSRGLEPGSKKIRREQITRRWEVWVKRDLGIKADLYSLKHLNTDETVVLLDMADAAGQNSHTSTKMVARVYAINEKERQHQRLKQVNNSFV